MRIMLVPLGGEQAIVVDQPMTLLGRKDGCDIEVEGEGVADVHCVFALADGLLLLRDLDTDRTWVNGQAVRRAVLLPDDLLSIGNSRFRVRYDSD